MAAAEVPIVAGPGPSAGPPWVSSVPGFASGAAPTCAPGDSMPGAAVGAAMAARLRLLSGGSDLLAYAADLESQHSQWSKQLIAVTAAANARQKVCQQAFARMQSSLAPVPDELQVGHFARLADLSRAANDAREAFAKEHGIARRFIEELQEAADWRRRVAKRRLDREREHLRAEQARLELEGVLHNVAWSLGSAARERERRDHARLERERERAHARRVELELERERLRGELAIERELRLGPRACAEVQTDDLPTVPPLRAGEPGGSEPSYGSEQFDTVSSDDAYEDDFDASSDADGGDGSDADVGGGPSASSMEASSSMLSSSLPDSLPAAAPVAVAAMPAAVTDEVSEDISSHMSSSISAASTPAAPRRAAPASATARHNELSDDMASGTASVVSSSSAHAVAAPAARSSIVGRGNLSHGQRPAARGGSRSLDGSIEESIASEVMSESVASISS